MAPSQITSSGQRKRTRSQGELDSSPAPTPDIAAAVKRRRLNSVANSSPSTPKGFSAITSAIGGVFERIGRRASAKTATAADKPKPGEESVYDVSSGEEATQKLQSLPIKHKKLGITPPPKNTKKSTPNTSVYDVPDSGDELELPQKINGANGAKGDDQTTPSKRTVANRGSKTPSRQQGSPEATQGVVATKEEVTPRRRGRPPKNQTKAAVPPASSGPAIKARYRGKPVQIQPSPRTEVPALKGILTPQKKKLGRPRKSVAFDQENEKDTDEVFFEDLPSKSSAPAAKKTASLDVVEEVAASDSEESEEDGEDSEDDEVCAICTKPDSQPPNQIIFCENCDMAVHQKCYNVPVIPEGDWICRNCSQEDVLPETQATPKKQTVVKKLTDTPTPNIPNFEKHLQSMQRVLLDRCSGNRRIRLRGQDEAYDKAYQLVEQTVTGGEGNSMMVIGARGCGKTTLVDDMVSNLKSEHLGEFHIVRLNGFIHTDDKLALKEIWRQLGKEMDIEDDLVNKTNNYADTMASLLALLSHPAEITGTEEGVTSKAVIFVIDEIDLFATHARQTLLYNLFDIAQAKKAPIAVLGLTTRIEVVESLEKRVKSRFSHRYVYMSLPKTLPAYWDVCKQGLSVDEEDLKAEGLDTSLKGLEEFRDYWEQKIEVRASPPAADMSITDMLQALRKTSEFEDHLEYHYYTTKLVSAFLTSCILPLSALSVSSLDLTIASAPSGPVSLEPSDPKWQLLTALSDLELSLLISAARLDIIAHTDTVNFAMAYDEYSSQMGKQRLQSATSGMLAMGAGARVWSRSVAAVAWERLVSLGLLIPAGIGGRSNAAHGGLEGKMWKLDVALEEIPTAVALPGFLAKWCSQI
ncbi:Uu.00g022800.m01.CDS01 [Anthostomella pinea]|uniref:Uu.00g022800.m01.CDS01 n=1 Tax=Anthostomella pinea TaxID=933095 RepID=A0AAI8VZX7_9PEZI|nr:Uu.00g022800.m01.CDS01 [Anthostomella pinea]